MSLQMSFRLELTSAVSLMTPLRSCVVAGCRSGLSTPSVGTTTLRGTRYSQIYYIRLSINILQLCCLVQSTAGYTHYSITLYRCYEIRAVKNFL